MLSYRCSNGHAFSTSEDAVFESLDNDEAFGCPYCGVKVDPFNPPKAARPADASEARGVEGLGEAPS